ncbi:MAG: hypothetical protein ABR525_01750 [Candidatus Limnocylindria bacterium]
MLRSGALIVAALTVIAGCTPATVAPSAPPSAVPSGPRPPETEDMTARLKANELPAADLFDLVRRLKGLDGTPAGPFEPVRTTPPDESVGTAAQFWTYDFDAKRNTRVTATLRLETEHAKWWIANDVTVDEARLRTTADVFETRIYPTDRRVYGEEWSPGIDGDPRLSIIVARIPGRAAGYFSSADEYPVWTNQYSAERELIYINSLAARFATDSLYSVLAHEFCHMIQFNKRTRSVVWFNEGQAQLCERLNGVGAGFEANFLREPDTQLNDWPELDDTAILHYGGSFLFLEYLRERAGGEALIDAFMSTGIDTPADLDAVLRARGQPALEELFADFVAANAFVGAGAAEPLTYTGLRVASPATATGQDRLASGASLRSSVHQYAARYVELPKSPVHVTFSGARAARVIPTSAHSGKAFWWSDRADGIDSTLTRTVDLHGVTAPKLSFWTWYELERDFDYAYVAVSADGGAHWKTLPSEATTTSDPNGSNLGNGFTGTSGGAVPSWIQQTIDLAPYADQRILVRFEAVTDGALNLNGFAVDDIEIPQAGLRDDAEAAAEWEAHGFIRSTNVLAQRYVVQLLRFGSTPALQRWSVDDGTLQFDLDASGDRRAPLLAVTGLAPRTTEVAPFELKADARP